MVKNLLVFQQINLLQMSLVLFLRMKKNEILSKLLDITGLFPPNNNRQRKQYCYCCHGHKSKFNQQTNISNSDPMPNLNPAPTPKPCFTTFAFI